MENEVFHTWECKLKFGSLSGLNNPNLDCVRDHSEVSAGIKKCHAHKFEK